MKIKMCRKFLFLGLMASTAMLAGQSVSAETLSQSILSALSNHPSVEAAMASRNIAKANKDEARSDYFPTVTAGTSIGSVYSNNSTSRGLTVTRGAANSGLFEADASVTQPLFNGFQTKSRIDAANARMQSADYSVLDVRENLALRATQAHIGVMQAQATVARTQSYFNAIEDYLDRIQLMVDEGVADESEVAQARNISLMLKSTLTDYEGQLDAALASYQEIVGQTPRSALTKPSNILPPNMDVQNAMVYAKNNHPLIKSKEKEMEAIGYDIKVEKGAIYPELDAEVSGIKRDQKEEIGGELEDARALLTLSWDFETGGASQARVNRSKAEYSEIIAQNKEQLRVIEGDIRRAYAELDTARAQVELVKQREVVTSELFEAYKTQFEGARVRLLQLMQAENQLFNSQLESITAEYRYLMAQHNVLASLGQLQQAVIGDVQPNFTQAVIQEPAMNKVATPRKRLRPISSGANFYPAINETPEINLEKEMAPIAVESKIQTKTYVEPQPAIQPEYDPLQTTMPRRAVAERIYIKTK